jgi:DNA-binding protein
MAEEQSDLNKVLEAGKTEDKGGEKPEEAKTEETKVEEVKEEPVKEEPAKVEEKKPEPKKPEEKKPKRGAAENVVLVGKKPTMSYVLAVVTQFSDGMDNVHIKARGRSISRAVDVAEVVKNRFVQGANTDVQIGTEEITDENNNKINVSTIDIGLVK